MNATQRKRDNIKAELDEAWQLRDAQRAAVILVTAGPLLGFAMEYAASIGFASEIRVSIPD